MIFRVRGRLLDLRPQGRHLAVFGVAVNPPLLAVLVQSKSNKCLFTCPGRSDAAPLFEQLEFLVDSCSRAEALVNSFLRGHLAAQNGASLATC